MCACVRKCARACNLIQHTIRKRHVLLSFAASLVPTNFSTLSHKRQNFRKNVIEYKRVFWCSLKMSSKTFLFIEMIQRVIVTNVKTSSHKLSVILVRFHRNLNFLDILEKRLNVKFHQNSSSGSRVFPRERTNTVKLTVAFRNVAN